MKNHFLYTFSILLIVVLCVFSGCSGPPKAEKPIKRAVYPNLLQGLKATEIPKEIIYKGQFLEGKKWMDTNGENFLVISFSGVITGSTEFDQNTRSAEYYAVQYVRKNNRIDKIWDLLDYEKDCNFDMYIGTMGVYITDLDSNGTTETKIAYKKTCRSDISPSTLKIIMHEGKTKMALRGSMLLFPVDTTISLQNFQPDLSKLPPARKNADDDRSLGRFENAKDFEGKPKIFAEDAIRLWKKLISKDDFKQL